MASDTSHLCDVCEKIDFERRLQDDSGDEMSLGPLALIFEKRRHCSFCNIVCESLEARREGFDVPVLDHEGKPIFCFLSDCYGGRSQYAGGVTCGEKFIRVELSGHWNAEYGGMKIGFFPLADAKQPKLFHRRRIDQGQVNFDTIKEWLQSCERWHATVDEHRGCGLRKWETLAKQPKLLRMIDVHRKCIRLAPPHCRYVALSYVWGGATSLGLSDVELLSQPDGLSKASVTSPICQTVSDAIELTRNIGEDYLWVDSLCIQQNDSSDKLAQIRAMHQIYGNATLTIIAAGGDDANSGLAGVRPSSRDLKQITAKINSKASLAVPISSRGNRMESSKWNTRAWTYQERLLSKRFLVFTPNEVYWHYRTLIRAEDEYLEAEGVYDSEMMSVADRLRFLDPHQPWSADVKANASDLENWIRLLRPPSLEQYFWTVQEYTRRELSYQEDILHAFAGIQRVLDIELQSDSWYGLPLGHLDLALLWRPVQVLQRRTQKSDSTGSHEELPTWSWAGWIGPIEHWTQFPVSYSQFDERIRPLLRWYRWDAPNGFTRIAQSWEVTANPGLCLGTGPWLPLDLPPDFFTAPPRVHEDLLQKNRIYFRTYCASFTLDEFHMAAKTRENKPTTFNITDAERTWVGLADMNTDASPGSVCDFAIVSEAQWVGLHSLDITYRNNYDHYRYFNVLAITWTENVAHRIGTGRIEKKAWAMAAPMIKDVVLE